MKIKVFVNIIALKERTARDYELALDLLELINTEKLNYQKIMTDASLSNDLEAIASEAHKMKSAVAILGFDNLASEIADLELVAIKKTMSYGFNIKINSIFISLNEHLIELENLLKNNLWDY